MTRMVARAIGSTALALALIGTASGVAAQETKIHGLFFGDYYYVAGHHDADLQGANGLWIRRLYLTVDTRFDAEWDARVRFEAASPGDFATSANMDPFLKDLYVRWRRGHHGILIGLSSSPTWSLIEGQWGYRDVEKTPLDLYKMGSSRDIGIALQGSLGPSRKVRYHVMLGNGAGTKSEVNEGKKVMGALQLHPTDHLVLEAYADWEDRAEDQNRATYTGTAVARSERGRVGLLAARQVRMAADAPDTNVDVFSVFGVLKADERVNLLARYDRMATPIPDGAKISYFRMDPTSTGSLFLVGLDIKLQDRIHLIPNVELVSYGDGDLDSDVFVKTTFSITF